MRRVARAALTTLWIGVIVGLLALGTWQVHRRAWKLDLIAQVDARLKAAPVVAPQTAGPDDAYRRVTVSGRFLLGKDSFVQASTVRGPGWWVITPLHVHSTPHRQRFPGEGRGPVATVDVPGRNARQSPARNLAPAFAGEAVRGEAVRGEGKRYGTILINRGYVPERRAAPPLTTPVTITGLLRLAEPGGGFLRSNDPQADRWYSRDVAAIAARHGLTNAAAYFIDADAARNAPGQPVGGLTVVSFYNNHLVYAITWYVLAMMSAAGLCYWIMQLRRGRPA